MIIFSTFSFWSMIMSLKNNNQEDQLIKGLTFSSSLKFKMKQKTNLSVTLNIICVLLMLNLGYLNSSKYYQSGIYTHYVHTEWGNIPAHIYLLQSNNRNTRKRCEICSKLIIKTIEQCQWRCSGVFINNYAHIPHLYLIF